MRPRRASTAIEFALALPLLLVLVAGVIDLGQYLFLTDSMAAAISEGARAGALADPDKGEDPLVVAASTADDWWVEAELPEHLVTHAVLAGIGAPNERLIVSGTVPFRSQFLFVDLPVTVDYTHTIRLLHQP